MRFQLGFKIPVLQPYSRCLCCAYWVLEGLVNASQSLPPTIGGNAFLGSSTTNDFSKRRADLNHYLVKD